MIGGTGDLRHYERMIRRLAAIAAALAGGFPAAAAHAAGPSDPVVTAHARSYLAPEFSVVAPGETFWVAFAQDLEPNWHVYWKNPGDSGLPLDLVWRLPKGASAGEIAYPLPERIPVGPLANFGHTGAPTFLIPIATPKDAAPGDLLAIGLKATWLICEEICVPEEGAFSLTVAVGAANAPDPFGAPLVAAARAALPAEAAGPATFRAGRERIVLETAAPPGATAAFFFPDAEGMVEPAAAQKAEFENGRARIEMSPGFSYAPGAAASVSGVVVYETADGRRVGFHVSADAAQDAEPAPAGADPGGGGGLPGLLLAAFFGGLILNVMPCVFPILFIKAAALAKTGTDRAAARAAGLAYAGGVVAAFLALGGVLLALRAGGEELGWGFHLQSPMVVLFSAYVLMLVGLNLAGVFSVGASLQSAAGAADPGRGAAGAFGTGALAVFVAAPCVGPLLAAPMGAALFLPAGPALLIFLALALGFAAPFSAVSIVPALARRLPRPGPWMARLRQAMAFPVFGAAAFFLWVLERQAGGEGLARALAGGLALAFGAWLYEASKAASKRALLARAIAALAVFAAIAPAADLRLVAAANAAQEDYGASAAAPFSPEKIAELRRQGRGVFVDFTAAWCVTCQVNKLTVLSRKSLAGRFAEHDVTLMVADWTNRDAEISAALRAFGASGVPLYVYYPPRGAPRIIPQPLSEAAILEALTS